MPRIRSLKPEIVSDVKLAKVCREARYTFVLMITQADDVGLVAAAHRQLLGTLYPLDEDVTVEMLLVWIEELVDAGLARWRATRDGVPVLEIVNWSKHQRISNAGRSQLGALLAESPDEPPEMQTRGGSPQLAAKSAPEAAIAPQPTVPSAVNDVSRRLAATRGGSPLGSPITDHRSTTTDHRPPITDPVQAAEAVQAAATALAVRANQGLREHPKRPQPIPRIIATSSKTFEAAEAILGAGVPLAFAESAVYELAKAHGADRQIQSLRYFVDATVRAWETHQAGEAADNGGRPAAMILNGNGRDDSASFVRRPHA